MIEQRLSEKLIFDMIAYANQTWCWFDSINVLRYSLRRARMGFDIAALIDWMLTVSKAITNANIPDTANTHH